MRKKVWKLTLFFTGVCILLNIVLIYTFLKILFLL